MRRKSKKSACTLNNFIRFSANGVIIGQGRLQRRNLRKQIPVREYERMNGEREQLPAEVVRVSDKADRLEIGVQVKSLPSSVRRVSGVG